MSRAVAIGPEDVPPEADRLEGFAHPRMTARLFGQEAAEATFLESLASGRPHHAWLLTGPEGVGKATLAWRIASFLLSLDTDDASRHGSLDVTPDHAAVRLVRQLAHPEMLLLRRTWDLKSKRHRGEITIDEVRRLRSFLSLRAGASSWRVVLIDTADDLNLNAANALLKSLEEPPPRCVFLLVSSRPGALLPTVRSRCRTLPCPALRAQDLRQAAVQALSTSEEEITTGVPSGAAWDQLADLAGGSVRRALVLHAGGGLKLDDQINKLITELPQVDWPLVHGLGDELGAAASELRYELFFELLARRIARHVRAAAAGQSTAKPAIAQERLAAWTQLWETLVADKAETDTLNLDRKALIARTFQRLAEAAR